MSQDELLARSDIVSVHTPSTPQTKGMVNAEFLGKMKPNAVFINTSRGNVVDEEALLAKLESCPKFWVGTDVYLGEPTVKATDDFNHPIAAHPRVYGTHHCGASTAQAESAIGQEAVRVIEMFNSEGQVDKFNWVNSAKIAGAGLSKVQVRHLDKVGVLAHCFQVFAQVSWNVQELENIVFKDRQACVANILFEGDASQADTVRTQLMQNADVLSVSIQ